MRILSAAKDAQREPGSTLPPSRFPLPDQLRSIATDLLSNVASGPPTHSKALTLLAADALITLAVELEFRGSVGSQGTEDAWALPSSPRPS